MDYHSDGRDGYYFLRTFYDVQSGSSIWGADANFPALTNEACCVISRVHWWINAEHISQMFTGHLLRMIMCPLHVRYILVAGQRLLTFPCLKIDRLICILHSLLLYSASPITLII